MARLESGLIAVKKVPADIASTMRDAVASVQAQAMSKDLVLTLQAPDALEAPHDPVWTKEALVNILDNAVKYTT